jgi:uncharacterized BrkB/YihY/UPF0761 family membrane protein
VDVLRPIRAFDRRQQRSRWLAIPVAVLKKFSDDGAGGLAALIAHYAFFSLFPLLLVFVTILGFVLHGDASVQRTISDPTRCLWIGVVVGSVVWEILQIIGGYYIGHVVRHASSTYGLFALVIGLLAWLHLGAQATLYAAEINVVVARRLWPRSLVDPPVAGDEKTLEALAKREQRHDHERIDVTFKPSARRVD